MNLTLLDATTTAVAPTGIAAFSPFIMMIALFAIMYFLMIRPQKKKEKEVQSLRSAVEIGDEIISIGGIVGRIVAIQDDTIVIESAGERTKIRLKRWAIQSVEKIELD